MITFTDEQLAEVMRQHVAAGVPVEKLEAMALALLKERLSMLTLDEAAKLLRCPSRQALLVFCRAQRIEVVKFSHKKMFILESEIARVAKLRATVPGDDEVGGKSRTIIKGRFAAKDEGGRMKDEEDGVGTGRAVAQ